MENREECPNKIQSRYARHIDWCEEADKICVLMGGYECETYQEFLDELEREELSQSS